MTGRIRAPFGTIAAVGVDSSRYSSESWGNIQPSWSASMYQTRPNGDVVESTTARYLPSAATSAREDLDWVVSRYDGALARLARG